MTDSKPESGEYGPATIVCPYCAGYVEVEAGPTNLCKITHCDPEKWIIVDLETGTAGRASA